MSNRKRDIISINDLRNEEIDEIFELADEYLDRMSHKDLSDTQVRGRLDEARGFVLATLFYEPSTRTRLSFESAMIRLGGHVLGTADPINTSVAKGESLADTVRVIENYADLIVLRHKFDGSARAAAEYVDIPVINGGDGSHEHPTQTLCDLYTLRRELGKTKKTLRDLTVLIVGDLKNGRTVHSLVYALARFEANIITMPAKGLALPSDVRQRLQDEFRCFPLPEDAILDIAPSKQIDAVYVAPTRHVQLALLPDETEGKSFAKAAKETLRRIDACYVTRLQGERLLTGDNFGGEYPVINKEFLKGKRYNETRVLHPLPRVDELGYDLDSDRRGVYFKQVAYSVPIRMALMAKVLGIRPFIASQEASSTKPLSVYNQMKGIRCPNHRCVTHEEQRYLPNKFLVVGRSPVTFRCHYCDTTTTPHFFGNIKTKAFVGPIPDDINVFDPEVIFFGNESQAREIGFKKQPSIIRGQKERVA